jgi:hypothetical protein
MASAIGKEEKDRPGLITRHVFLDTQAYRAHAHDLSSAPFKVLASLIDDDRVTLHTTDITLEEASRHIGDEVATIEREAGELRKKHEQWERRFPRAKMEEIVKIDADELAKSAVAGFRRTIQYDWKARTHEAAGCNAGPIFKRYFARKPPFDAGKGKEFPDAFVVEVLANWCKETNSTMYVITADAAMQRAALDTTVLIPTPSLQNLLEIAAEAETPELTAAIEEVIETQKFFDEVQEYIQEHIGWLGTIYSGDYTEGEILDIEVSGDAEVWKYSIISAHKDTVGAIFSLGVPLDVTFQFIDEGASWYDRESGEWGYYEKKVGSFEDTEVIRVYIEFNRENMSIVNMNILTSDLHLSEPYENYK